MIYRISILSSLISLGAACISAENIDLRNNLLFSPIQEIPIFLNPPESSGLNSIVVLYNSSDVTLSFTTDTPANIKWKNFNYSGVTFAEEINDVIITENESKITLSDEDMGYIISDGKNDYYIWIINYAKHTFNINSVSGSSLSNCDITYMNFIGSASPIYYYTLTGKRQMLSREITVRYSNLKWDEENSSFKEIESEEFLPFIDDVVTISPPLLTDTDIMISGDQFLKNWNKEISYKIRQVEAFAVDVHTNTVYDNEDTSGSNIIPSQSSALGGNAPFEITFEAFSSDKVVHYEWQLASDANFDDIIYRVNDDSFSHNFTQEGTFYVRFIGSNFNGSCLSFSETYEVNIGASILLTPNIFSPNGDGINDLWKVSYKSIVAFDCWIFDRNGQLLYNFNNPSGGWDGYYNGRKVAPGVYYYIIKAEGADGKRYNLSGDINIINYKDFTPQQ